MSSLLVPRALQNSIRQIVRSKPNHYGLICKRSASSKHPRGFAPPSVEDLSELRERVQEFTRKHQISFRSLLVTNEVLGREIPEDVAAKTDSDNEFPRDMWEKLGQAG